MENVNINLPGYRITNQLYAGSHTLVYQAVREADQYPVVLKLLREEYPSFAELVRFRNQYVIAQNLALSHVVTPIALERYRQGYVLVMEDVGGISLADYLKQTKTDGERVTRLSIQDTLRIGVQLAETLWGLHCCRVIHKDIKPANILIQPETLQIKLIDFSISSLLSKETPELENPNLLEGTLAYLSPEQTGRMNRGIDYRSDFYSLGVTLYELLTGQLPFLADDPMEWVHCHIAKIPVPVIEINPNVPQIISDIVAKLMAKNAEDRYQSGWGLKFDLERCLEEWKQQGEITLFPLGKQDVSDQFLIPEKLYGRELEVQKLLAAFDRVSEGVTELMLVSGFSGIGKTAVVNEIHKPIVRQRGYFIKGKFDQFNRNIPLSAFVQAFQELIEQLLCESEMQLAQWKTRILEALGDNAQVIIAVIPELQEIIGEQPSVPELSGSASQNRFNLLFQKFIEVLTTAEHPLVIFLDDLQWADTGSLDLMKLLINQSESGYLLMIGAYRDHEVSSTHPLILTLEYLKNNPKTVNEITLNSLPESSVNQLICETLNCSNQLASPLTKLVFKKTQGNPFFTTQFIKALHEEGLIHFNREESYWECDIVKIRQLSLTDDVVEFMAMQLEKLPLKTQEILKLAACIGNSFDLITLAIVSEKSEIEIAGELWAALQDGFVIPQTQVYKFYLQPSTDTQNPPIVSYKFLHDRVQQAAYSLIPREEKQSVHLKIGQLLKKNTSEINLEERIFEIVSQLNIAVELITSYPELQELAELNLIASRKAKASTAYAATIKSAKVGLDILTEKGWKTHYHLTLELHEIVTEAAYLNGDFEQMEAFVNQVLKFAKTPFDQVKVYQVKIEALTAQGRFKEAIAVVITILQSLGIELPVQPNSKDIEAAFQSVSDAIANRHPQELLNLPQATDIKILAAARILTSSAPVAYLSNPSLYLLIILKKVDLSIVYGNESTSPFAYASYGILMCGLIGNVELGYQFGQLALDLLSRYPNSELKGKILLLVYAYTKHWKIHLGEILNFLKSAYCTCLDLGDFTFAGYAAWIYSFNSLLTGQSLTQLESEVSRYCEALNHLQQPLNLTYCQMARQVLLNLTTNVDQVLVLKGVAYDEDHQITAHEAAGDRAGLGLLWISKLVISYLFADFEGAVEHAQKAQHYLDALLAFIYVPIFHFYESLAYLAVFEKRSALEQQQMNETIAINQEKMKNWSTGAPSNFQHKYDLVEAERYRVLGQREKAIEFYERAITGAKDNSYLQEEALANELAAKFYLSWGKPKVASGYMQEAYYGYTHWEARAKVRQLEYYYPQLLQPIFSQPQLSFNPLETLASFTPLASRSLESRLSDAPSSSSLSNALDFTSILKAAQAINRSLKLEELISHLTRIILENSGAETCVLLLPQNNQWQIRAITRIESGCSLPVTYLQTTPLNGSNEVPVRLIHYVKRTQELVMIDEGNKKIPGGIEEYLLEHQPQSIFCTPILNQGSLVGVLYLEHRLTKRVFTRDRILVLNFLCTQAAISLENARLYQQATEALTNLQAAQLQLVQSEKMSALGSLMAGIAHEINNPVGFISGNLSEAKQGIEDLINHVHLCHSNPTPKNLNDHAEEIDLDYLIEDLPRMIESMQIGCDRIKSISSSLRIFSRADQNHPVLANIHQGLDSTLLILKHRLKASELRPDIKVNTHYGKIPDIECFPGQLNQVFMNILANAIDALDEASQGVSFEKIKAHPKQIWIVTKMSEDRKSVVISIADNGRGISEEMKEKVFEHLFTTKPVGKGTGLGLAIAHQIVVEKHRGSIEVNSQIGEGTEFIITLPIKLK